MPIFKVSEQKVVNVLLKAYMGVTTYFQLNTAACQFVYNVNKHLIKQYDEHKQQPVYPIENK